MALQVFTASLLKEGLVAYLCQDGSNSFWSTELSKAVVADEASFETLKLEAERGERDNIVIAPYPIDVDMTEAGILPSSKREQIRAKGPTVLLPQSKSSINFAEGQHAA